MEDIWKFLELREIVHGTYIACTIKVSVKKIRSSIWLSGKKVKSLFGKPLEQHDTRVVIIYNSKPLLFRRLTRLSASLVLPSFLPAS